MALSTKPKPTPAARKRQAKHHRQSKHYVKAYLPYLPMLAVVGIGQLASQVWIVSGVASADTAQAATGTRLAAMTGNYSLNLFYTVLAVTFAAFAVFVLNHWYRLHKWLNRGEMFMVEHAWFDIGLVVIITAGVLLTRVSLS